MRYVTLGDVCKKASSNIAQKDILSNDGKYPIYGASGLIKTVDFYHQEQAYIAIVKDGAGVGRTMLLPEHSSVIGTMQYIIPNELVDIKYLYYAIVHMDLAKYYMGAAIPHIYFKDYQKEPLKLPLLSEQKRIAAIFEKIDSIIEYRNSQLAQLEQVVKSRFIELFGKYADTTRLSEVAAVTGGLTKNSKRDQLPLQMPYLRVANVGFASIDVTEMLDIGLTKEECEKTLLQYEDLLFVEGNGSPDQIGRVAIWRNEIRPCVHQNHLIKSRFDQSVVNPVFAMHYFMSQRGREQIKGKAVSTSGLYTLSVSKVAELLMPVPPMALQKSFAAFVEQTDKSKYYSRLSLALCRVSATLFGQEWMKCQTSNS